MEQEVDYFSIDYAIEKELSKSEKILEQIRLADELGYCYARDILHNVAQQHTLKAQWLNEYKKIMNNNTKCLYTIVNKTGEMIFVDTDCNEKIRGNSSQIGKWKYCPFCGGNIYKENGNVERT